MADDVLTEAEREVLLAGRATSSATGSSASTTNLAKASRSLRIDAPGPRGMEGDRSSSQGTARTTLIDTFRSSALRVVHEGAGRDFGASLSALLRSAVEVKSTTLDELAYGRFVCGLSNPSCTSVLSTAPVPGRLVLDLEPAILYPLIDRLLGGGHEPGPVTPRAPTEIELRLVARVTSLFLRALERAWQNVVHIDLAVERVESNPQLAQIVPATEIVAAIGFELTLGEARGKMRLCIPCSWLEQIGGNLSGALGAGRSAAPAAEDTTDAAGQTEPRSAVALVAHLAETRIAAGDLANLRVGDIITTETDACGPIVVSLDGVEKYLAQPGTFQGHKAVRIDEPIPPQGDAP